MKKLVTILCLFFTVTLFAQKGNFNILNMGSNYRVNITQLPKPPNVPYDIRELRIDVFCLSSMQNNRTVVVLDNTTNLNHDYYLNGMVYVYVDVIYKKGGQQIGMKSLPSKCIFGLNPSNCVQKL